MTEGRIRLYLAGTLVIVGLAAFVGHEQDINTRSAARAASLSATAAAVHAAEAKIDLEIARARGDGERDTCRQIEAHVVGPLQQFVHDAFNRATLTNRATLLAPGSSVVQKAAAYIALVSVARERLAFDRSLPGLTC